VTVSEVAHALVILPVTPEVVVKVLRGTRVTGYTTTVCIEYETAHSPAFVVHDTVAEVKPVDVPVEDTIVADQVKLGIPAAAVVLAVWILVRSFEEVEPDRAGGLAP
jgi:hypothetical protein